MYFLQFTAGQCCILRIIYIYIGVYMTITVASLCVTHGTVGNVSRQYPGIIRLKSNDYIKPCQKE